MTEMSIYEIEFDLRQAYSQQYYDGVMDDGHAMWMQHLQYQKSTRYSNYFWKEIAFGQVSHITYDTRQSLHTKYHLFDPVLEKMPTNDPSYNLDAYDLPCVSFINDYEIERMFFEKKNIFYW